MKSMYRAVKFEPASVRKTGREYGYYETMDPGSFDGEPILKPGAVYTQTGLSHISQKIKHRYKITTGGPLHEEVIIKS